MRLRLWVEVLAAALLVILTGGSAAFAQWDSGSVYSTQPPPNYGSRRYQERVAPRYETRPRSSPGYERRSQPQYGTRYQPQPAPPSNGGFFFPWFQPAQPAYQPEPSYRPE